VSISGYIYTIVKFKEYLSLLIKFAEKHLHIMELDVIASGDSEGNYYERIYLVHQ